MMVINGLRDKITLREISRISGISMSRYYYRPVKRSIQRLDLITKKKDHKHCIREANIWIQESVGST